MWTSALRNEEQCVLPVLAKVKSWAELYCSGDWCILLVLAIQTFIFSSESLLSSKHWWIQRWSFWFFFLLRWLETYYRGTIEPQEASSMTEHCMFSLVNTSHMADQPFMRYTKPIYCIFFAEQSNAIGSMCLKEWGRDIFSYKANSTFTLISNDPNMFSHSSGCLIFRT